MTTPKGNELTRLKNAFKTVLSKEERAKIRQIKKENKNMEDIDPLEGLEDEESNKVDTPPNNKTEHQIATELIDYMFSIKDYKSIRSAAIVGYTQILFDDRDLYNKLAS